MSSSRGKNFVKDIIVYFLGYVAPKIISFILVPIYTAYLSKEEYGSYDYVHTVIQALTPIISLQIPGTIMRFVIKDDRYSRKEIISNGYMLVMAMGAVMIGITVAVYQIFSFSVEYFWLIIAMGFTGVMYTMAAETTRGIGYTKTYAFIGALNTLLTASLSILFIVVLKTSYNGILMAASISSSICVLVLFIFTRMFRYMSVKAISPRCCWYMMKYALPLIPNAVSWWALSLSDKLVIKPFLGVGANGIYAVSGKLASIISICYHSFDKAWMVNAIKEFDSEDKGVFFSSIFDKLFRAMMLVCAGLLVVNRVFIGIWVSSPEFYDAWMYSIPLIIATAFYCFSQFFGVAYNCSKKTHHALFTTLLAAAVNLGISLALVKVIGLYAMAYATLIAYIVLFIVRKVSTRKYFPVNIDIWDMILQTTVLAVIAGFNYIDTFYISLPIQAGLFGLLIFKNRKVFMELLSMLKSVVKKVFSRKKNETKQ